MFIGWVCDGGGREGGREGERKMLFLFLFLDVRGHTLFVCEYLLLCNLLSVLLPILQHCFENRARNVQHNNGHRIVYCTYVHCMSIAEYQN